MTSSPHTPLLSFPRKREPSGANEEEGNQATAHHPKQLQALGSRFRGNDKKIEGEKNFEQGVLEVLSVVPDPEIPCVSVVDLGIVREVRKDAVVITPTYTGCPATIAIQTAIRAALDRAGLEQMRIDTALFPPWTTDWISDEGREKLCAYGIAPPPRGTALHSLQDARTECPRCGSQQTEEISRFGSTPCKALHRCLSCGEPFDRFKCH